MGLVYDDGNYVTLTDILGAEDAFGDMDFKVAGTADAVTALQLDTKIDGLPAEVLSNALDQAKTARLLILDVLTSTIAEPRSHVAEVAPKIVSLQIPIDKIGEVIGPKGKVINTLQQETGADIAVDDDGVIGTVTIGAKDGRAVEEARRRIEMILDPPTPEVGATYQGRVVNLAKFGAFVSIMPGRDGLLHISKMAPLNGGKRIGQVEDVLELGQAIEVKVDDIDPQGKVSLSLVGDFPESEEDSRPSRPRDTDRDRGPRDRDRDRAPRDRGPRDNANTSRPTPPSSSFEAAFEAELAGEIGDLGPGGPAFVEGDGARRSPRPRRR
jgi:polyribonucleotide nucleotidyltransferase